MLSGSCLCGAIKLELTGSLEVNEAGHGSKCRKWSGHYWASGDVSRAALTIHGAEKLTWFRSSEKVQRGFCSICGSSLLFDPIQKREWIGVALGAFDGATGTKLA